VIEIVHPSRPRVYVRKFDHEEAARRIAAGETRAALAREYGVSASAITLAVDRLAPAVREEQNEQQRRSRTTTCDVCGGPAMKLVGSKLAHNHDGRNLCGTCRPKERRENVRVSAGGTVTAVRCQTCREWCPPSAFQRGWRYRDLREGGFHNQCRACGTVARRAYRNRNKVSCEGGCGRMVEGKGRATTSTTKKGRAPKDVDRPYLCKPCWQKSPEGQEAIRKAVAASMEARRR
jgi:hypothetical protein